jgi:hypothetical protein
MIRPRGEINIFSNTDGQVLPLDETVFEPGVVDNRVNQLRAFCVFRPEMLFVVSGFLLAKLRMGRDGVTYYAAIMTVFKPDIFRVNSAPIVVISLLRYSLDSPV